MNGKRAWHLLEHVADAEVEGLDFLAAAGGGWGGTSACAREIAHESFEIDGTVEENAFAPAVIHAEIKVHDFVVGAARGVWGFR